MAGISKEQYEVLLRDLAASRVAQRSQAGRSLSYLEAWDVKAHLIRIFGFGGWSSEVLETHLAFEEKNEKGQWSVGYRVVLRLTIHEMRSWQDWPTTDSVYTEAAVGSASLPQRGEAHDMAIKTAESDALKRAAINLGTQFGLSLYDNGSRKDVVGRTLVGPEGYEPKVEVETPEVVEYLASELAAEFTTRIEAAVTEDDLKVVYDDAQDNGLERMLFQPNGDSVHSLVVQRLQEMRA